MIEDEGVTEALRGAVIERIETLTCEEETGSAEYCSYKYRVVTNRGVLEWFGYHDCTAIPVVKQETE